MADDRSSGSAKRPPRSLADKVKSDGDDSSGSAGGAVVPPRRLADRVPKSGGPSSDMAILRALNAAEDLIEGYQGWAVDDLEDLWRTFQAAVANGNAGEKEIAKIFDIAHEIRGQGGTFGFPLITIISDSLCKYLDQREAMGTRAGEVIKIHIFAMKAVFRQGLKGDQGKLMKEMPQLLAMLRDRADLDR